MHPVLPTLRTLGLIVGVAFVGILLWVAVIGPAILSLLEARS